MKPWKVDELLELDFEGYWLRDVISECTANFAKIETVVVMKRLERLTYLSSRYGFKPR